MPALAPALAIEAVGVPAVAAGVVFEVRVLPPMGAALSATAVIVVPLREPQRRAAFFWAGVRFLRSAFMHSGQMTPTAACVWHSGQMVRMHRWQSTKLCRSGCR